MSRTGITPAPPRQHAPAVAGSERRRRPVIAGLALLSALFLVAAWLLWAPRGGPERVLDPMPVNYSDWVVRGGRLYWPGSYLNPTSPAEFVVHAMSVTGGNVRPLVRQEQKTRSVGWLSYTKDALYYTTYARPPKPSAAGGGGFASGFTAGVSVQYLGEFLWPPGDTKPAAGETRIVVPYFVAPRRPSGTLHWVPLAGGPAQIVPLDRPDEALNSGPHAIIGNALYWIRPRSGSSSTRRVQSGTGFRNENRAENDLMITPLGGGATRRAATGLPSSFFVMSEDAIFWLVPRVYPDRRQELYGFHADAKQPFRIPDYTSAYAPVAYQGRWYWLETFPGANGVSLATGNLVSTRMDGSDRRVVPQGRHGGKGGAGARYVALVAHRGLPYLLFATEEPSRSGAASMPDGYYEPQERRMRYLLARFHPDRPNPVGTSRALPRLFDGQANSVAARYATSGHFDGNYFYYAVTEGRASPLDFLSAKTTTQTHTTLYRVPLPQ